ncbi:MAG: prolipoprotein diacylglyceryl transferase [Alphaproteobacteria bacterium]|nr:prolipoprotein diacylglyceryl transferase [Alphaproteobacteria bacterium]
MAAVLLAIPFPAIDPVLIAVGPFAIRWYALAYIAGLVLGWRYMRALAQKTPVAAKPEDVDDFLVWATLGVILGGRLGYILFYRPGYYLDNPAEILAVWRGGMSFHGGILGVTAAGVLFVRRRGIAALPFADRLACAAPMGIFFGRIANFINGELWGRAAEVSWAVVFPHGGPMARHPSQLYEAVLEGAVLFAVLYLLQRQDGIRARPGLLTGVFLAGYGLARGVGEVFREPDAYIGVLPFGITWGQWLSAPMLAIGIVLIARALRKKSSR